MCQKYLIYLINLYSSQSYVETNYNNQELVQVQLLNSLHNTYL